MTETNPPDMPWHVLGAGSIGCLWAGYLALEDYPVTLILKDSVAGAQFRDASLLLETATAEHQPAVTAIETGALDEAIEWLLVTTKSFATLEALATVQHNFTATTRIILLQNGMGMQERVARRYPELTVIAGTTTDGAFQKQRFHVVHAGHGDTRFGALSPIAAADIDALVACFSALKLDIEWVDDINTRLWHKVAINSCINALTALKLCRNGALLEDQESLDTILSLAIEAECVMRAASIPLPQPGLYACVLEVLKTTGANFSSMHQDLAQGRRTEIDAINGFICAQGRALNIQTPVNYRLLESVLADC